jgi:Domain of unknown function (DUF4340)
MSPKVFVGLLVITVLTSAAAAVTVLQEPAAAPVHYGDQPAFPALRANPDAVAKVVLTTPEGTFTLVRETGDRWSSAERFGYAVDGKRVRDLVVALADMRLIEAKTMMPERYSRIQVEDLKAKDAKSRLLRLESADGKVLAEALIGKQHHRLTGNQSEGTYLRRPGEAQAWLASGGVQIEPKVVDWLDKQVVDLSADSIRRIEIRPEGSDAYVAERAAAGAPLALPNLAAGETPKKADDLKRLAGAFADIKLDDVKRRSDLTWPSSHQTAVATTFDGVEVTVQLAKIDDQPWAIFDARDVAAVAPAPGVSAATGDQAAAAPATKGAAGETTEAAATTAAGAAAAAASEAAEGSEENATAAASKAETPKLTAGEINERVANWAYKLPTYVFDRLTKPRTEWLENSGTS